MSQICDIYYILLYLYTIATPDDMDPNSLRLPEVLIFFSHAWGHTDTDWIKWTWLFPHTTHTDNLQLNDEMLPPHFLLFLLLFRISWIFVWQLSTLLEYNHLYSIRIYLHIYLSQNISPGDKRKDLGGTQVCAKDCGIQANPCSCSSASKDALALRVGEWGERWWTWVWLGPVVFFFFNEKKRF